MSASDTHVETTAALQIDHEELHGRLAAVFFTADEPLLFKELATIFEDVTEPVLDTALRQMQLEWTGAQRGIHLVEVAGGWQFRTNPDFTDTVLKLYEAKPTKLTKAALETLAIVAYRQPVTRAVVDQIRGVDSSGMLRKLCDLELTVVLGKMDDIGRPNLYGTSERFLEFFGLRSLEELPTLEEFDVDLEDIVDEVDEEE